ncbi:MAG TPA: hypothetical protein VGL55_12465 [Steroidobacteraceae bacterium]|jgi:hypothetical protein
MTQATPLGRRARSGQLRDPQAPAGNALLIPDPSRATSAVEAAALLVSLAIQDSRRPVEDLGGALQRMSQGALAQEALARELAVCVESLQFHDRLVQQLAFARDLLTSVLSQRLPDVAPYGAPRWSAVLAAVRGLERDDRESGVTALPASISSRSELGTCELF